MESYMGYLALDCAASTQNLLLAAHELNLGAVWTGVYPRDQRMKSFQKLLKLPEKIIPYQYTQI